MAEKVDIWMPVYVAEYLASTMHLTTEESGAYLHLMFHSWKNGCPIPKDLEQVRRITRVEKKAWPSVWASIKPFWTETDHGYTQARIERERARWTANRQTNVARATAAAAAREKKRAERNNSETSPRSSPRSPQDDLESIPSSSPSPNDSYESSQTRESNEPAPVNLNPAAVEIICAHPAAIARRLRPSEVGPADVVAVVQAIRTEARETGCSLDSAAAALMQFTRSYASAVALWPSGEQRFVIGIPKFFTTFEYRKNPETWRRDAANQPSGSRQQHGTRARTASEQRHSDGLAKVLGAFADVIGEEGFAGSDGKDNRELRDAVDPERMARGDAVTLDGYSGQAWHGRPA